MNAGIELLERIFAVPDTRPLSPSDLSAANRRHDEQQPEEKLSNGRNVYEISGITMRSDGSKFSRGRSSGIRKADGAEFRCI
jgi:hypothetical protein